MRAGQAGLFPAALGLQEPLASQVERVATDWAPLLRRWASSPAGQQLMQRVDERVRAGQAVFPGDVFRALRATPLSACRVLILGQDPYHGLGQADGLAFSVPMGQRTPPSLRNILHEQARDLALPAPAHGCLATWAEQGVLLLNTSLTVEEASPASHSKFGWEVLTDMIFDAVVADARAKVLMLWGAHAQAKASRLPSRHKHLVLQSNHPSPLSARRGPLPFIGCGHFGLANGFLSVARPDEPALSWR